MNARRPETPRAYDAVLIASFGGPEGPDDVMPFLDNVLRGRNVPHERKLEVAQHYELFGGVSPINEQNRVMATSLQRHLRRIGIEIPVYLGNRNWHPYFETTIRAMADDGIRHAVACFPSAFTCYSSCRQYWEDIAMARGEVGAAAPSIDKVRAYYNHPRFIQANVDSVRRSLQTIPGAARAATHLVFTAHSIPTSMAAGSAYVDQLRESSRLVAAGARVANFTLAFQSRSGPPHVPWVGPDINECLAELRSRGVSHVIILPIGFLTDHIEVQYDLDTEARATATKIGIEMIRADTIGHTDEFIAMLGELIVERMTGNAERPVLGRLGPHHAVCPTDCCRLAPTSL